MAVSRVRVTGVRVALVVSVVLLVYLGAGSLHTNLRGHGAWLDRDRGAAAGDHAALDAKIDAEVLLARACGRKRP